MKNKLLLTITIVFFGTTESIWSQYGFGTNNPNASAAMEIVSPDKGVLIPKISLTASSTFGLFGVASHTHHGMLVFNTATATVSKGSGLPNGLYGTGVYYWHQPDATPGSGSWKQVGGQELKGEFTQSSSVSTSLVTLTLNGNPNPVVLDVSALEEIRIGTGTPTLQMSFTPSATVGTLYYDTASSTVWGYTEGLKWEKVTGVSLYSADGTLLSSRTVTFDNKNLNFVTGTGNFTVGTTTNTLTTTPTFQVNGTDNRVYMGTTSYTGTASYTNSLLDNYEYDSQTPTPTTDLDLVVKGDVKIGRFIVDENDNTGRVGEVLGRSNTGVRWTNANSIGVKTLTASRTTPPVSAGLLLLEPNEDMTLTLPEIGSSSGYPIGHVLKIRRNIAYSSVNTITIEVKGTASNGNQTTIGGVASRNLNMGYQSLTLVAASKTFWAVIF